MAFVPATNVLMCEARWTLLGQQVENVTYWLADGEPFSVTAAAIAAEYQASWVAHLMPLSGTDMSLREMYFTDLTTETSPTYTVVPGTPIVGTGGTPTLPSNISLCISFRTEGRGRSSRGRNYLFGLTEGVVTGNTVSDTYVNAALAFYEDWAAPLAVGGLTQVVISRIAGGDDRVTALVQPVTARIYTDQWVDAMRRRLPGRGS
jgi:hypothetical protein